MTAPVPTGSVFVSKPAKPVPEPFPWLPPSFDPLRLKILEGAWRTLGILEDPLGSNRGPEVDQWLRRAHVPEELISAGKGNWCACWAGAVFIDAGAQVPRDYGACDAWLSALRVCTAAELATVGQPGDAVLFGKKLEGGKLDAVHIGILVRMAPIVLTVEGNRGVGAAITNNGVIVDLGPSTRLDVLGVVRPVTAVKA